MSFYLKLLRHFLSAGILFGLIVGIVMAMATNWVIGLIFGFASGCILLLGVPAILTCLSVWKKRTLGGENGVDASQ